MIKSAKQYHDTTSYERNRLGGHQLDWKNQPLLYKEYKGLAGIPLPENPVPSGMPLKSVLESAAEPVGETPDIKMISRILRLTYSITAESRFSRGIYYYRSAASAGALYPVEIYLMIQGSSDLEDGVYHFNIMEHSLVLLRKGIFSSYLGNITVPRAKGKPLMSFILSSIFFRSSWKYRDRAYRYHLLDTGHVLENLSLALKSAKIPFEVNYDFHDDSLNNLAGIDGFREASLAVINVPGKDIRSDSTNLNINPLYGEITGTSIMSGKDIDYPAIREIHEAGKIIRPEENHKPSFSGFSRPAEKWQNIDPPKEPREIIPYPESLFTRRSKRNFINEMIGRDDFMTILDVLSHTADRGNRSPASGEFLQTAFFAESVEDVSSGLYSLDVPGKRFGILRAGIHGEITAHICLNQEWLKNAGLHFLIISDLELMDKTHGPRGYRYAMMEAGRMGQRLYITAASLGLGCCGIGAFYDSEAAELLELDRRSRLLYLIALGKIKKV